MLAKNLNRISWLLLLLFIFLIKSSYTDADIFAERTVTQNKFGAISLDFSSRMTFNDNTKNDLSHSLGFMPGGFDLAAVRIRNESNRGFKYRLKTLQVSGHDAFCQQLQLEVVDRRLSSIYKGPLVNLIATSEMEIGQSEYWVFFISFDNPADEMKNKICEFNFDFKTYRQDPNETGGIFAQREVRNVISSGDWQN